MGCPAGSESVSAALGDVFLNGWSRLSDLLRPIPVRHHRGDQADGTMSFTEISLHFNVSRDSVTRRSKKLPAHPAHKERGSRAGRADGNDTSSRIDPHDPQALFAAQAQLVNQALDAAEHALDRRTQLAAIREARDGLTVLIRPGRNAPSRRRRRDRRQTPTTGRERGELSVEELNSAAGRANVTENF